MQLLQEKSKDSRYLTNNVYQNDTNAKVSPRGKTRDGNSKVPGLPLARINDANRRRIFSPPNQVLSSVNALISSSRRRRVNKNGPANISRDQTFDSIGPLMNSIDSIHD